MKVMIGKTVLVGLLGVGVVVASTYRVTRAQAQPAAIEKLQFHHVHLNSVNPTAAAEYYPRPFAQSATDRFRLHQRTAILRRRDLCHLSKFVLRRGPPIAFSSEV